MLFECLSEVEHKAALKSGHPHYSNFKTSLNYKSTVKNGFIAFTSQFSESNTKCEFSRNHV